MKQHKREKARSEFISSLTGGSAVNWQQVALDALDALCSLNAHYDDLCKSNPGFMGKICLQDYAMWNEALLKSEEVMRRYAHLLNSNKEAGKQMDKKDMSMSYAQIEQGLERMGKAVVQTSTDSWLVNKVFQDKRRIRLSAKDYCSALTEAWDLCKASQKKD